MSNVIFREFMPMDSIFIISHYSATRAVIWIADATVLKQSIMLFTFMCTGVPIRGGMFLVTFLAIEF